MMSEAIMIVEDDPDMMQGLGMLLKVAGYRTLGVKDGPSTIHAAQQEHPALIILDLMLPGCDGITVLRSLKQTPSVAGIPVIIYTALDPEKYKAMAMQAGAVAFLSKPTDNKDLLGVIARYTRDKSQAIKRPKTRKILVVEDDDDYRRGTCLRLQAKGFKVVDAADSITGVGIAMKENPDLILLDLGLPGGNGFVFLDRLRSHPTLALVPVILLSAWDPASHQETVVRARVAAFLRKPVDSDVLMAAIRKALV